MIEKVRSLIDKTNIQLEFCRLENEDILENSIESMNIYRKACGKMYSYEKNLKFLKSDNEIDFYKRLKPTFISNFFYFCQIQQIEYALHHTSPEIRYQFLKDKREEIFEFDTKHADFIVYLKSMHSFEDKYYYNRDYCSSCLYDENLYLEMKRTSEPKFDILTAQYMANQKLDIYLITELKKSEINNLLCKGSTLKWTGSQVELVELVYSLHASRLVEDGTAKISVLIDIFSFFFGTKIPNHVKSFEEIRTRSNLRNKLVEKLSKYLIKYINDFEK